MSNHIEGILNLLASKDKRPVSDFGIRRHLGIKKEQLKSFYKDLKKLRRQGKISKVGKNRYVISKKNDSDVISGILKRKNGVYFIENSEGEYILPKLINKLHAVVGDDVVVLIEQRKYGFIAKVLRVFERKYKFVVGYLRKRYKRFVVEPIEKKLGFEIRIENFENKGANDKDVVLCEITQYPSEKSGAKGKVVKVYGKEYDNKIDEFVVSDKYNLPRIFSDSVLYEADLCSEPSESDFDGRKDFRYFDTITIDGVDAKDFDDAVDIEKCDKYFRLYVHIADVSNYVTRNSNLDKEAYIRGFSVYFPGNVIPMLPYRLSDNICSLVPNRDRLTLSVIMDIDFKGNIKKYSFVNSIIRNKHRMTYREVENILFYGYKCDNELEGKLKSMKELASILRKKRLKEGSIDLNIPEAEFTIKNGEIVDIQERPRLFSHSLVEEFMLAANLCSADFLSKHFEIFIRRIHKEPDVKKILTLSLFLKRFGIKYSFDKNNIKSKDIQKLLEQIEDENKKKIVSQLVLRSLARAEYSVENTGHFALGFKNYTHFTSPIRRYPDLVTHRMIKSVMKNEKMGTEELGFIASGIRDREIVTEEAEFYMDDIKSAAFMYGYIGEIFEGRIISMIHTGIFVRLNRFFVEGFVPAERMEDDYYEYYEELFAMIGRRKKKIYRLGDNVKVKVVGVNKFAGEIDFVFV